MLEEYDSAKSSSATRFQLDCPEVGHFDEFCGEDLDTAVGSVERYHSIEPILQSIAMTIFLNYLDI